jgi:acetyl esterase
VNYPSFDLEIRIMPLSEQAQAFIDAIAAANPPPWESLTPREGREAFSSLDLFGEGPSLARVENRSLPGDINVRIFSDAEGDAAVERRPAVLFFHGGGWVLGNLDTHDALCRRLAKKSSCTIISVDYSLSPEALFPTALQQCYDATRYVAEHADEIGVRRGRLAVAGDSAGGNLATAVAIKALDEGGPPIELQVLIYPVIEPTFETESYRQFGENHGLSRGNMEWFWQQYLGEQEPVPLAAPIRRESLAGLPRAHVITAEYDVLRDEGEAYAKKLSEAGVPTTIQRYDGNLHGFIHFAAAFDDGIAATHDVAKILNQHLLMP